MRLPDAQGEELLRLARSSIEYGLHHQEPLPVDYAALPRALAEPGATFTTLHRDGRLRGCCGRLEAKHPLAADVAYSAFQAAFRDPRFDPVLADELGAIRLEVSVLSTMEAMSVACESDLLEQLMPGEDGLVIVEGARRATFLPKVWEQLPEPRQFLGQLKLKCGLPKNYWSERLEFRRYRTASYAESGQGRS
jgi:AmmeMemoRadiSam system protein A